MAVCDKTYEVLTSGPYAEETVGILPRVSIADEERDLFDCARSVTREPRESKGGDYRESRVSNDGGTCC